MTFLERFHSKLSYKLYVPIIIVSLLGLSFIVTNSFISIEKLKEEKHLEVQKTYQYYVNKAIDKQTAVVLSNVIALSLNQNIVDSLVHDDRELAKETLQQLVSHYENYSGIRNTKIHLHTKSLHSFIRSWKLSHYGDDLSGFRHSLKHLGKTRKPFVTVEIGRAGILLRGIAPVYDKKEFVGSIEFIQSFDQILTELKSSQNLDALIVSSQDQTIKFFNDLKPVGLNRVLLNSKSNETLIESLQEDDFGTLSGYSHVVKNGLYFTSVPLYDFRVNQIGLFLIVDSLSNVETIIAKAQESFIYQLLTMLTIVVLIILVLAWVLHRSITSPIEQLNEKIINMNDVIDDLGKLDELAVLEADRRDELGSISRTFNSFIHHISDLFSELQKSTKINQEYLKAVYAGSIVSKSDLHGNITYVNDALCFVTGYKAEELIGKPHQIFRHPSTSKATFRDMWRTISQGKIWHGLFKNCRKDGSTFYANITVVPIQDESGRIIEYLALRDDVTELVESQKKLRKAFNTDSLTSLGNRFKLLDDNSNLDTSYMAILDIRSFKEINDFYGHGIGDQVIQVFANELFDYFDDDAFQLYRLQGDEFAVLADGDLISDSKFIDTLEKLVEIFLVKTINVDQYMLHVDITVGLSINKNEIFTEADIAHKTAKKQNQNLVIYSDELKTSEEYKNNLLWTNRVKKALTEDRIVSYYQPIVSNDSLQVEKYESLIRMYSEEGDVISPYFFLEISKKARLYTRLTKTMINHSFKHFSNKKEQFSINLTADDMVNEEVINYLMMMLEKHQVSGRLVIEIVESESIQSFDEVLKFIEQVRSKGCRIAVDDFGTGYSNFEFLLKLKPDFLKIDGSMIQNINSDSDTYNVVETIVAFAKKNNIETIAEFVSDAEIFKTVKDLGIDYSQGYFFGKPSSR